MIRGSVYRVDLGDAKRGREQRGKRLGIVVSDSPDMWTTATIIPTSTRAQDAIFRPRLHIAGRDTLALIDQVRTIDTSYVDGDPVDHLDHTDMMQVDYALGRWLRLRVELDT
ncbi:type II toxin-antitoxin system PemK/MazF family toxin [Streptomyces sp. Z26]|uniref:type II toxin-antitoxin system PemK/MazF family toxin n=1 Tax=Streptomyces TaxID=1883 RepID=UPI000EF135F0|nr:type II toxin-antitoxin system PemK/MazF family toxin [Streptomyces sp. Z26]RLL67020.1 type II toxin-antitoxin system PemK/MazF family toxin [Streptomyces sp. Z26]